MVAVRRSHGMDGHVQAASAAPERSGAIATVATALIA
jgi:hypothetical protein